MREAIKNKLWVLLKEKSISLAMNYRFTRFLLTSCIITLLTFTYLPVALADGNEGTFSYRIKISSQATGKTLNEPDMTIDGETIMGYTWKSRHLERTLTIDSLYVKVIQNGQEFVNAFMSRTRMTNTSKGETVVVNFENASEEQKRMLRNSFGVPVCKLLTDQRGKEIKRTLIAGPGAKGLIDDTIIANAVLLHPMFPGTQDQWQADSIVSMGSGGFARGKLTYRKQAKGSAGQTRVNVSVSGTVTNDDFKRPGTSLTLKAVRYVVTGNQTYDTALREWVSGQLSFDISFQIEYNNMPMGSAKGKMQIVLEMLPLKQ